MLLLLMLLLLCPLAAPLNIVVAGGTGPLSKLLLPSLSSHAVTVLCRNAFLASAPSRASGDFGHLGAPFLARNAHVALRDWDGFVRHTGVELAGSLRRARCNAARPGARRARVPAARRAGVA